MWVINTGGITANKPFDAAALNVLENECSWFDNKWLPEFGDIHIEFEGVMDSAFDEVLEEIVQKLKPLGYVFNGEVQYYGDYEGKIYVENNKITLRSIEDTGLYEACDAELIQMLKDRGYIVTKKTEK